MLFLFTCFMSYNCVIVVQAKELRGYQRPDWQSVVPATSSHLAKNVYFKPQQSEKTRKSKTRTMFEAVRKTLDEEKWREKLQHKVNTVASRTHPALASRQA